MDEIAISYLGYLPQEMEGTDIFNFYHPGDLVYLKEAYENIIADQGKPFKSREYRFKAKNGCYLTLETIWSCFINPWSKKLEFVDAKHTIVKEPLNRDIFAEPGENGGVTDIALESGSNDNTTTLEEDRKQVCPLKVAFFQKVRFVFQISKSQNKILQIAILNLKFEIPAHNLFKF